jgi:3-phenylpropionate/trans-cinnamate dioxygenase ferredoxin reductase component
MATERVEHLLIGGGLASAKCARTLREHGAPGRVMIVGREPDPPYNRPDCSKGFLRGEEEREDAYVDEAGYYEQAGIEVRVRTSVMKLDARLRMATLSGGEEIEFEKALLATGANVRRLAVEGCQLSEIHYLRTLGNSETIRGSVAGAEHIVIIGGSYIGCEVAASLTKIGHSVTVVMQEEVTLERGFGREAGRFFEELLSSHGVTIHGQDGLARLEGEGRVRRVITDGGLELPADVVVIGAGVSPDVQLARSAGLALGETGGIRCDSKLRSAVPEIFAAGDACEYESVIHGRPMRIEHWDVAFNHGETAGRNMLGAEIDHEVVPYFFSVLADWAELEYVGPASHWDQEILRGHEEDGQFTRWYLEDGSVRAALTVGRPDDLDHARRLIRSRAVLHAEGMAALADLGADLTAVGT